MKKLIRTIEELRPIDDTFMKKLGENRGFCEELLQTVLGNPNLEVLENTTQKNIHNIDTRSVTVDILCKEKNGVHFSVEVQKADDDNHLKRVRYNGACVQILSLEKGKRFEDLPDVYMIYITETDIFKKGKTIYHFDHVLRETGELMDNGYHEIYVNAEINDGTELAEYMKLFKSPDVMDNQKYPNLCDAVRYYKKGKGRDIMCAVVEEYAKECVKEKALETAKSLIEDNVSDTIIQKATGLTFEEIASLHDE
ncbi:MAG: PD-(D/E)XK nuclease family transposase [Lachnospiraceae bacterium]